MERLPNLVARKPFLSRVSAWFVTEYGVVCHTALLGTPATRVVPVVPLVPLAVLACLFLPPPGCCWSVSLVPAPRASTRSSSEACRHIFYSFSPQFSLPLLPSLIFSPSASPYSPCPATFNLVVILELGRRPSGDILARIGSISSDLRRWHTECLFAFFPLPLAPFPPKKKVQLIAALNRNPHPPIIFHPGANSSSDLNFDSLTQNFFLATLSPPPSLHHVQRDPASRQP